ncbi:MAG: MFS transporter [Gammaproteobacteria bacterium]|nr:MFS transporter [Gammaproteobacteria bacterium]
MRNSKNTHQLTDADSKATARSVIAGLASVVALRNVGVFMLLPLIALHAETLAGSTPLLVGVAVGMFGICQAAMQWPFGWLSDRIGRRSTIAFALLLLAAGSVVCAIATRIEWFLLGRLLQGLGAIASIWMAWLSDHTPNDRRTRAMAWVGAAIGSSFMLSLILGPVLTSWITISSVFWVAAGFAVMALIPLARVPEATEPLKTESVQSKPTQPFGITNWVPFIGIFGLHLALTLLFVVLPFVLRDQVGLSVDKHWWVYVPSFVVSIVGVVILIRALERTHRGVLLQLLSMLALLTGLAIVFIATTSITMAIVAVMIFFTGFNFLESHWPALASQQGGAQDRGQVMGIYKTFQFMGEFAGGVLGGILMMAI